MYGIAVGIVYVNAVEWLVHRYLLHGLGRKKTSVWSFHWHEHHKKARRHDMVDDQYAGPPLLSALLAREKTAKTKEVVGLVLGGLLHAPLIVVAPWFTLTVWAAAANYYRVHRKAHIDPAWAAKHLPWHVDHHMGKDQDANWCVTWPLMDWVLGTRVHYLGTPTHDADVARVAAVAGVAADADA